MSEATPKMPFRMIITDVFTIKNRGVVVVGKIESGELNKNDSVLLIGQDKVIRVTVSGIEMINPLVPRTNTTGLLLRNLQREDVEIGMIVTTEGI